MIRIQEPRTPSPSPERPVWQAVGIDLGTTHSLVALMDEEGVPQILTDPQGRRLMPSVVRYLKQGGASVGHAALEAPEDPEAVVLRSTKRWLGKSPERVAADHPEHEFVAQATLPTLAFGEHELTALQAAAELLKSLYQRAMEQATHPLIGAVITIPAYFDDTARQATLDAAALAGVPVLRLIAEPTAAAMAYDLDRDPHNEHLLVFDLGGGTLDVSLLERDHDTLHVLAVSGNTRLGGDDMDRLVQQACGSHPSLAQAKILKEQLSQQETAEHEGHTLDRQTLEHALQPLMAEMKKCVDDVLHETQRQASDLSTVLLAGGATRVPCVQQALKTWLGRPLCATLNPDEVVALGACVQAARLTGHPKHQHGLLLDVTPLSLGIALMDGLVEKMIVRNSPLPCSHTEIFTTHQDHQTGLILEVVQGERELAKDARPLGRLDFQGIPPMPAGMARIEVTFALDTNGVLSVTAREQSTGTQSTTTFTPMHGLSSQAMQAMLLQAIEAADADRTAQAWAKAAFKAEHYLRLADTPAWQQMGTEQEQLALKHAKEQVLHSVNNPQHDPEALKHATQRLDEALSPFVNEQLTQALQHEVVGRNTGATS